ncbi:MAG: DUF805 domain-containing protein [Vicinamibacteria bacterium]
MISRFISSFFAFMGRLSRGAFVGRALFVGLSFLVFFVFIETMLSRSATWILYPPLFLAAFSLSIRRLKDRATSAWWLLAAVIPVLGPLWLVVTLFLRGGSAGENQFGLDPREDGRDYLQVNIHQPGPDPAA